MDTKRKTPPMKTVEKALDILDYIGEASKPLTANEVATASGISLSSAYKFLSTLVDKDYLTYQPEGKKYFLGNKILRFSKAFQKNQNISGIVFPFMEELSIKTKETIHLAVPRGIHAVFVEKIDSPHTIGVQTRIGTTSIMSRGATPQAIMAFCPDPVFNELCRYLEQVAPNPVEAIEQAKQRREQIRRDGYAITCGDINEGVGAIAVPIFNGAGEAVASIAIAAPEIRFTPNIIEQYIPLIVNAGKAASLALG